MRDIGRFFVAALLVMAAQVLVAMSVNALMVRQYQAAAIFGFVGTGSILFGLVDFWRRP